MRKKKHPEHVNHERWLISYADFITLLFAFFVVMFAVSQVDSQKVGRFTQSFQAAIGIELVPGGSGIMPEEGNGMFPGEKPPEDPQEGGKGKGKGKGKANAKGKGNAEGHYSIGIVFGEEYIIQTKQHKGYIQVTVEIGIHGMILHKEQENRR